MSNLNRFYIYLLLTAFIAPVSLPGDDFEPRSIYVSDFEALIKQSPFNRSVNPSDSLIITGIATIDSQQVATLLDTESKQTYLVSSTPNKQGWKMVEVKPNEDLDKVTARIQIAGELVSVRYAAHKLKPGETRRAGASTGVGETQSGKHPETGLPDDIQKKVGALSEERKEKFASKMQEMRERNPDMTEAERSDMARRTLEKMTKKGRKPERDSDRKPPRNDSER